MQAREVGDGNLNFVYIVEGPEGGLVVKQALPFLRLVGDDWPLGQVCSVSVLSASQSIQLQANYTTNHCSERFHILETEQACCSRLNH